MNRHGFLKGYDELNFTQKAVRAIRVSCSNRGGNLGCGRTFSVWIADKVKRLFLDTKSLWQFLHQAATTGNISQAFHKLDSSMADSAVYRIWKRFLQAQSTIRTALTAICSPPKLSTAGDLPDHTPHQTAQATIAHLQEAFNDSTLAALRSLNPIEAYQVKTQSFFI